MVPDDQEPFWRDLDRSRYADFEAALAHRQRT
jgi:hypothetical protein